MYECVVGLVTWTPVMWKWSFEAQNIESYSESESPYLPVKKGGMISTVMSRGEAQLVPARPEGNTR